jgi:Zn-dependent protease
MKRTVALFGVAIAAPWTLFAVFVLALHTGMVLHRWLLPGLGTVRWVLASIAFAMGLFASLGAHELVRANRSGARRMTLFVLGAALDRERRPIRAAITAWLTTVAIAVVLIAGVAIASAPWPENLADLDRLGAPGVVLLEIAAVNLLLAAIHLLPVYPLDAGRAIAALTNRRVVSLAGLVFGATFVAAGVIVAIAGVGPLAAVWFAVVGWFLAVAATETYALKPAEA